jgi:nucleoside-diphosphate-sugar epimerase
MMEYSKNNNSFPKNFYAITKYFFQTIEKFYKQKNNKIKFYDLKLYETYGDNDKRKKLIPEIIENYKKNKTTKIISRNLNMNFIHVKSLIKIIDMIIFKKIKENEYVVKNKKIIRIKNIIESINKKLNRKIKVKYLSSKKISLSNTKLKIFPNWSDKENLKEFLLEKLSN